MFRRLIWSGVFCLGLTQVVWGQQALPVLEQIPADAQGFLLVENVAQTSQKAAALAQRLQLPIPSLSDMVRPFSEGMDQQRHLALAWLPARAGDDAQTGLMHFALYIPVSDYTAFTKQFGVDDASGKPTKAVLEGQTLVVAKKGDYAVVVPETDEASLQHVLGASTHLAEQSAPLVDWLTRNDISLVLSPSGTDLLMTKLKEGLGMIKAGAASVPGASGEMVAASLDFYENLFDSAGQEFSQVSIGLRVDPQQSVSLHKRLLLKADGSLASGDRLSKPQSTLVRLPAGPYLMAFEGVMPSGWSKELMAQSFSILKTMQGPDAKELSPEQIEELSTIASQSMQGVHSMSFAMGVGEADSSMYSRAAGILQVDDSQAYMKQYESSIEKMAKIMRDTKLFGAYDVQRDRLGDRPVLHITMDMTAFAAAGAESVPNLKEYYENMFGPGGKLSIYVAPAAKDAVAMAYVSKDNLERVITAYQGDTPGLGGDAQLKETAGMLPPTAQWAGYMSPQGIMQFAGQMVSLFDPSGNVKLPEFPPTAPIGMAGELTPTYLDVQLVVPLSVIEGGMEFANRAQNLNQ